MANTFNLLRSNDLIWSFVVNNYLLGKEPFPFDLLYWNADSTRMPAAMHSFYLRKMYLENRLVEPRGIRLADVPIDLRRVRQPTYIVATREDHIAPWTSAYGATRLYSGPMRFVLSASGHIAGVINPPDAGKYCYRTNPKTPRDPEKWLAGGPLSSGLVVARLGPLAGPTRGPADRDATPARGRRADAHRRRTRTLRPHAGGLIRRSAICLVPPTPLIWSACGDGARLREALPGDADEQHAASDDPWGTPRRKTDCSSRSVPRTGPSCSFGSPAGSSRCCGTHC